MKRISIFKKIRLYFYFRKQIKRHKSDLLLKFNMRVDRVTRLYTVLNIPPELIPDAYNLKKSDIDRLSAQFIREYSNAVSDFLDNIPVKELYSFYQVDKIDKYGHLIVIGFSLFRSDRLANVIFLRILPILTLLASILMGVYFLFIK